MNISVWKPVLFSWRYSTSQRPPEPDVGISNWVWWVICNYQREKNTTSICEEYKSIISLHFYSEGMNWFCACRILISIPPKYRRLSLGIGEIYDSLTLSGLASNFYLEWEMISGLEYSSNLHWSCLLVQLVCRSVSSLMSNLIVLFSLSWVVWKLWRKECIMFHICR